MISAKLKNFKYVDRNKIDTAVLIPGWATDYRIFDALDINFNYLLPVDFSPFSFRDDLMEVLERLNIKKVSLFGWSLGGFAAQDFISVYPGLIDRIILASIRKRYKKEDLDEIRTRLNKSKRGYLYKFYAQSFCDQNNMSYFKKKLLKVYLEELELEYLFSALDYLERSEINPALLKDVKEIKIIHGDCDKIAPIEEALEIKKDLPQAEFITIKGAGHGDVLHCSNSFDCKILQ